jgi:hypothetical protein
MDYHARFFDEALGRFISPDSITPGGPQGLNRYAYVLNNPINFIDPSGHNACAAYVNGMCVHEVSDSDQKLINSNGATISSPSSSVVVTTATRSGLPAEARAEGVSENTQSERGDGSSMEPTPPLKVSVSPAPDCSDPIVYALHGNACPWDPNPQFPNIDWKTGRDFFGTIDPFDLGPLSGSGINNIALGLKQGLQSYLVYACGSYCLQNPQIGVIVASTVPIAWTMAIGYDFTYDQITNTGNYNNLPPRNLPAWSELNATQKVMTVVISTVIVIDITLIFIPK